MAKNKGTRQFLGFLVVPLLLIIVITGVLTFTGHTQLAWLVSQGGTILVHSVVVAYVVFFDSKNRWPGQSAFQRFANVMSFKR